MNTMQILSNEDGNATITTAGIIGALVMVTVILISIATITIDTHCARVAAELAAVAGAEAHYSGADACEIAETITTQNHATMTHCHIDGNDVEITTTKRSATAKAKAGPL